jgi:esterase/lipase superfamily enzyme
MEVITENKDQNLIESARWFIEQGLIQIYCPVLIKIVLQQTNTHPKHKIQNHVWYDKFFVMKFRACQNNTSLVKCAAAGCFEVITLQICIPSSWLR